MLDAERVHRSNGLPNDVGLAGLRRLAMGLVGLGSACVARGGIGVAEAAPPAGGVEHPPAASTGEPSPMFQDILMPGSSGAGKNASPQAEPEQL
eukprot:923433-Pyramimonas_sp.AAC.1